MTDIHKEQLIREIETLKQKVAVLEGQSEQRIPTYRYHKTRDRDLTALFDIERNVECERLILQTSTNILSALNRKFLPGLMQGELLFDAETASYAP